MEDFIKIKERKLTKIGIKDEEGNDTGEYLEFDFEDIELPLKYQECIEQHKRNVNGFKMQLTLIDKKQNREGKKLLSSNAEDTIKAMNEFYKREMETMDLFLGKDGCKKLLNGRKPYFTMFDDINEMLEPILPKLEESANKVKDRIISKYSKKEDNILE